MFTLEARKRTRIYFSMALGTAAMVVSLSGCFAQPKADNAAPSAAPVSEAAKPLASPTEEAPSGMEEAFIERDTFLKAQQLPMDGTPLVAVTGAQKKLVSDQQAVTESHGAVWTAQH